MTPEIRLARRLEVINLEPRIRIRGPINRVNPSFDPPFSLFFFFSFFLFVAARFATD